jgi:hypothetical protein
MAEGFVYLLTSPNSPYVKIGGTENPPAVRVREINGAAAYSAVGPWHLSDFRQVHDWRLVKAILHGEFGEQRVRDIESTRELFAVPASEVRRALAALPRDVLVRCDEVDRMFQMHDLALYLERLFRFAGLTSWLHMQGAWTLRLFPSTSGGRHFTLNIGGHEVAWSPLPRRGGPQRHALVVDELVADIPDVIEWLNQHDGEIVEANYKTSFGRAVIVSFAGDFAQAEQVFQVPGVRRALLAYWGEALTDLHERSSKSVFARFHDFNAVSEIVRRIEERPLR